MDVCLNICVCVGEYYLKESMIKNLIAHLISLGNITNGHVCVHSQLSESTQFEVITMFLFLSGITL